MPSNKSSFYDGCVVIDNSVDNLDVSGWINRTSTASYSKGVTSVTFSGAMSALVNVGDKLMKSLTNEYLGKIKSIDGAVITFEKGINVPLASANYVHVYPKFEIVRIDILGPETYISSLVPADTRFVGSSLPDLDTWASKTQEDFGSADGGGTVYNAATLVTGTVLEGRWKYVMIDNSGAVAKQAAICYLKATPVIM